MKLLDRYLFQVGRFLNKKEKEDTLNELKSLILDQLDERLAKGIEEEQALHDILKEFGEPRVVAYRYKNTKPLMSEGLEAVMWVIIKNVAIFVPIAILLGKTMAFINSASSFTVMDVLLMWAYSIPSLLNAVILSCGTIFFVFLMIERYSEADVRLEVHEFEPKALPPLPKKVFTVSIVEAVITIIGTVLFLYILNLQPGLISIKHEGTSIPVLNQNFETILPFININMILQLGVAIYYLAKKKKNKITKTLEFLSQMFSAMILLYISNNNIFDQRVFDELGLTFLNNGFRVVMLVLAIITALGAITQYVKMYMERD